MSTTPPPTPATAPTVTGFTPASGLVGTPVTITGTSFAGATALKFNGTTATFTVSSATQITTSVPAGATSGKISVTTSAGTASSAGSFTVTSSTPTITSFAPASAVVGTTITITGTNFWGNRRCLQRNCSHLYCSERHANHRRSACRRDNWQDNCDHPERYRDVSINFTVLRLRRPSPVSLRPAG
jgi:hypothetical protein